MSIIEEYNQKSKKKSPLKILWNIFSVSTGILSLSSITENFVKWKGYIDQIINSYRSVIHPIFEFLFSWIPLTIPPIIYDYLVLGMIVAISYLRALHAADKVQGFTSFDLLPSDLYGENIFKIIFSILARIIFWPIILVLYAIRLNKGFKESESLIKWQKHFDRNPPKKDNKEARVKSMVIYDFANYIEGKRFYQWIGTLTFGIVILLILNSLIN